MSSSDIRRILAFSLAVSTLAATVALPVQAGPEALFQGRVLLADGVSPRAGVTVALVDDHAQQIYRSDPTDSTGTFRIEGAPAGTYGLVAETPEGAFLAGAPVTLSEGANRPLALSLQPASEEGQPAPPAPPPKKELPPPKEKPGMATWKKWTIAGAITVTGLLLIEELTKESEKAASSF